MADTFPLDYIDTFHVTSPDDVFVVADVILGWAHEAGAPHLTDVDDAMAFLTDQGTHTFAGRDA